MQALPHSVKQVRIVRQATVEFYQEVVVSDLIQYFVHPVYLVYLTCVLFRKVVHVHLFRFNVNLELLALVDFVKFLLVSHVLVHCQIIVK